MNFILFRSISVTFLFSKQKFRWIILSRINWMKFAQKMDKNKQNIKIKKGSPGAVAPACAGSGEGSDHFGSLVRSLSLHFCKRLFPGLEPVTSWSQGSNFYRCAKAPLQLLCQWNSNNFLWLLQIFTFSDRMQSICFMLTCFSVVGWWDVF